MKTFNKKLILFLIASLFVGSQALPLQAVAKENKNIQQVSQQASVTADGFCNKLDSLSQKMLRDGSNKKLKDMEMKSLDESQLYELRSQADKKRDEHYQKLYEKYSSDKQRAAIDDYRSTMSSAIIKRRQSVDDVRVEFINNLNKLIDSHKNKIHDSEQGIIDAVQSAYNTARTNCSVGMDGDSVRANFKNSLRNAKENFTNSKSRIVLDKNELESLKKIRENSIQTAVDDFKRSAEDAKNKLLQSLNS